MSDPTPRLPRTVLRLADLSTRRATDFSLVPDEGERAAIAASLDIVGLRKLRFDGRIMPEGRTDWRLEARLGATAVQDCVVTFDPVTTRIEEDVVRRYLAEVEVPDGGEVEMPDDDTIEPLPAALDLVEVMTEALALALPAFPRVPGLAPADITVTEAGKVPLTDEAMRPFAGLAGLRDRLGPSGDDDAGGGSD